MQNHLLRYLMPLSLLAPSLALAQGSGAKLEEPPSDTPNRIGLGYRMGFNISAQFQNVGSFGGLGHLVAGRGFQPVNPGPATGHGINRTYEDGYNWVDNTHNALGYTRFWGYDNAGQVQNGAIVLHDTTSTGANSKNFDDDPIPGFELTYNREFVRKERWRAGLEAAFGYSDFNLSDNGALGAMATRINDAFAIPTGPGGPVVPPPPPYRGPFTLSPNGDPVLSDLPVRSYSFLSSVVTGGRSFGADIFSFRFGPYIEFPISEKVTANLSGGFALGIVRSDYSWNEMLTVPGVNSYRLTGASSDQDVLPGGFIAGTISAALSENWAAFAGAQFEGLTDYTHSSKVTGEKVVMDLSQAVFVTIGLSHSF